MFPSTISNGTFSPAPSAPPQPPEFVSMMPLSSDDHALLHPITPTPSAGISIKTSEDEKIRPQTDSNLSPHSLLPWSTGLCDCCHDPSSCCLTCCCPCIAFGRIAEIADRGSTSFGVSGGLYLMILLMTGCSCFYRSKLRGQYFWRKNHAVIVASIVVSRHVLYAKNIDNSRTSAFDMSIGWHGNMERRKPGANSVPPSVKIDIKR